MRRLWHKQSKSNRGWIVLLGVCGGLGGCQRGERPGAAEVPAGVRNLPGPSTDIGPRWSPDGRKIAFLRATPDRKHQLFLADARLHHVLDLADPEVVSPDRPLGTSQRRYASPDGLAWSPDSHRIAFNRVEWFDFEDGERLPGTGLWTLDIQTGQMTPLALHPRRYQKRFYYYRHPQWSPDGRYVAFVEEGVNGQRVIAVQPVAGQEPSRVEPRYDAYEDGDWPTWEPALHRAPGSKHPQPALTFRRRLRRTPMTPVETVRQVRIGTTEAGEIWRLKLPSTGFDGRIGHLRWSPNGERLAFSLTTAPNDFTQYGLWMVRRDGTGRCVRPAGGRGYFAPVWIGNYTLGALSPNGSRYDVVTIEVATGRTRTLGTIESADCDWSPERSRLVYALPSSHARPNSTHPTTLRIFETHLYAPTNAP